MTDKYPGTTHFDGCWKDPHPKHRACIERHVADLERELADAKKAAEIAEEKLGSISDWCKAYPLDIFPEPDMELVRRLLGDTLLSQLSAHNMRHVIEGISAITAPTESAHGEAK